MQELRNCQNQLFSYLQVPDDHQPDEKPQEYMKPTNYLIHEHRAIRVMLSVMNRIAENIVAGKGIDSNDFNDIIEFLTIFVDKSHHGKEENAIYPVLVEAGINKEAGLLYMVLNEHTIGRGNIKEMSAALKGYIEGNSGSLTVMADNITKYTDLIQKHMEKEENALFPMVEKFLMPQEHDELFVRFQKIEEGIVGPEVHEKFHDLLKNLRIKYLS